MAKRTNQIVGKYQYYRITRTIGHKLNVNGQKVAIKKQFTGKSKKEAEEKYQEFLRKQKNSALEDQDNILFSELGEKWVHTILEFDSGLSENTRRLYIGDWNRYIKEKAPFYYKPLASITSLSIQEWYNQLDCPTSALKSINKVLRRFYKYLDVQGYVRNITLSLVIPERDEEEFDELNEIETWEPEELETILSSFSEAHPDFRLRFLLVLLANTGLRISEALAIKYSDFDLEEGTLSVTRQVIVKSGKLTVGRLKSSRSRRLIPTTLLLQEELKRHREWQTEDMKKGNYQTDYVFTTSSGKLYDRHNARVAVNRYYNKIGVKPRGFHCYRHTMASELCRKGVGIEVVADLLGHTSIDITAKYYLKIATATKKDAMAKLDYLISN